jgi:hypothetical protein
MNNRYAAVFTHINDTLLQESHKLSIKLILRVNAIFALV